jgi:transcriptional regulator with XRE-family HTH domain
MHTNIGMSNTNVEIVNTTMSSNFTDEASRKLSTFSERLEILINESDLDLQTLAEVLGLHRNTIFNYRNGRAPRLDFLIAAALALNAEDDLLWLIGIQEQRENAQPSVESVVARALKLSRADQLRVLGVLSSLHSDK